ncbi:TIGR03618 family F420-dependent PPOX class oxidoreductase [Nocardioides sp. CER19]|uniref:TIGR03618 family F420-dependent PPOX class oxidoreductase n=1 Tax=Nocardioides sp. CER19 TaxID=3038538 RepID=UPI002448D05D|nr:TIGR03618 family F420-dependent PPOX class oxidoreductase [Nocardioides sp. CER19]MDH2414449.1 TIGR03618 family F420-dependent PPOX class oxidoreductase [Nocardioides sp. CER19]
MAARALDTELVDVLDSSPTAHVATLLPDGAPHSVPVWTGTHEGHVVIMTGPCSQKARNLRRDPRVAISLTPTDNPSYPVVLRGRVVTWLTGEEGWAVVDAIAEKYIHAPYDRSRERVVAMIAVDHYRMGM